MIIKAEAENYPEFHSNSERNPDGTCVSYKRISEVSSPFPTGFIALLVPENDESDTHVLSHLTAYEYHMPDECYIYKE